MTTPLLGKIRVCAVLVCRVEQYAKYQVFGVQLVLSANYIVQHFFRLKIIYHMRRVR